MTSRSIADIFLKGTICAAIAIFLGCKSTTKIERSISIDTITKNRSFNYSGSFDLFETIDICAIDTTSTVPGTLVPRCRINRKITAHQRDTVSETDTTTAIKSTTRVRTTVPCTFLQGDSYARWWLILKLIVILFVILILIRKVK